MEVWGIYKLSNDGINNKFNKLMMDNQNDSLEIQKWYQLKSTNPDLTYFNSIAATEEIYKVLAIFFSTKYLLDEVESKFGLIKELLWYYILYLRQFNQYINRQKMSINKRIIKRTSKVLRKSRVY